MGTQSIRPLLISDDPTSSETSHTKETAQDESHRHETTISMLPDDVLLGIFDSCRKYQDYILYGVHGFWFRQWHLLVHVCRTWRHLVFASPRRLNLQLLCTHRTPVRKILGIWPDLPIIVNYFIQSDITSDDEDNILAALKHRDRVGDVTLALLGSQLGKLATVMQEPFPVLTRLHIFLKHEGAPFFPGLPDLPSLPAEFLGGSAPCLQEICLVGVPYPALPKLLLSTSDLVKLDLSLIPSTGYISPEAMVASLAALPRLEMFVIEFAHAMSRPRQIRPPYPPSATRTVLPALSFFAFQAATEYLEDLVGRIDAPRLNHISTFYLEPAFQAAQLSKFIDRSVGPLLTKCRHAEVSFARDKVTFEIFHRANDPDQDRRPATTIISYEDISWHTTPISQVLDRFPAPLSNVVHLELKSEFEESQFVDPDIDWLHLLHQFSAMQTLLVHRGLVVYVAHALIDITEETATEGLLSVELICLEKWPIPIHKFVAARRYSGCPVTVVNTIEEFRKGCEAYIRI